MKLLCAAEIPRVRRSAGLLFVGQWFQCVVENTSLIFRTRFAINGLSFKGLSLLSQ